MNPKHNCYIIVKDSLNTPFYIYGTLVSEGEGLRTVKVNSSSEVTLLEADVVVFGIDV